MFKVESFFDIGNKLLVSEFSPLFVFTDKKIDISIDEQDIFSSFSGMRGSVFVCQPTGTESEEK